jgi:hypothetical protein
MVFVVLNINIEVVLQNGTERRVRVVNTPASYSGGSGLNLGPDEQLCWLRFSVVLLSPPMRMPA